MYLPDRINSVFRCNFLDNFSSKKFARRKSGTKRIVFQPYFDPPPTGREGDASYLPRVDRTRY